MDDASAVERDWWAEPFLFFEPRNRADKGKLAGATRISLSGYTTAKGRNRNVDHDDDMFMAAREVAFLFRPLARWSRAHGITWLLSDSYAGDCGRITRGRLSARAKRYLAALAIALDDDEAGVHEVAIKGPDADDRATRILKKHADRKPDRPAARRPR